MSYKTDYGDKHDKKEVIIVYLIYSRGRSANFMAALILGFFSKALIASSFFPTKIDIRSKDRIC